MSSLLKAAKILGGKHEQFARASTESQTGKIKSGSAFNQRRFIEAAEAAGYSPEQAKTFLDEVKSQSRTVTLSTETPMELVPLDKRRRWTQGTPTGRGGSERQSGVNPDKVRDERESRGQDILAQLSWGEYTPDQIEIEDCSSYRIQVGCDIRIWLKGSKTLLARVDIKSGNRVTDAQLAKAFSSQQEGVPYYIFDPDSGQAMIVDRTCIIVPKVFAVYAATASN